MGESRVRVFYDPKYDILYIDLRPERRAYESRVVKEGVLVDYDVDGSVVGVEIWNATRVIFGPIVEYIVRRAAMLIRAEAEKICRKIVRELGEGTTESSSERTEPRAGPSP